MFTGIIQEIGRVASVATGAVWRFEIAIAVPERPLEPGESIALEGVCLTVVTASGGRFALEVTPESLRRSTLGELKAGSPVNVERAVRMGDRLGGHLVLGHVDACSRITAWNPEGDSVMAEFELPAELAPFFVEKGSVAVDGISLTVANLAADRFSVALIPETLRRTTLGGKRPGARVNLEADVIGKYVARLVGRTHGPAPKVDEEFLKRAGFA